MDKRTAIISGILLLVVGGAFAFLATNSGTQQAMQAADKNSSSQASQEVKQEAQATPAETESPVAVAAEPGTYVDYSDQALAEAKGTKLIFFHATWCPQCRSLEADIKRQGVPEGVTVLKADYDTNQQLRQKYGVAIQTTVVRVDDSGNFVEKYVAYEEPTLSAVLRNLR